MKHPPAAARKAHASATSSSTTSAKRTAAPAKGTANAKPARPLAAKSAAKPAGAAAKHAAPAAARPAPAGKSQPAPASGKAAVAAPKGSALAAVLERRASCVPEDRQSQLKLLIARGKEQGYLTYAQVNDHLPSEIVDPEQIEDIVNTINDMGIPVYEKAPDSQSLLASDPSSPADEEAIEEAAAALAALDAELGRTTDPVRMYMREMGTVELLTREGEIRIAKRIEEGLDAVRLALASYPATHEHLLRTYEQFKAGQARMIDLVVGFIDPNAPDVIAQPQNPTKVELVTEGEKNDEEESDDDDAEEEVVDTGPDPEEVARRMGTIRKHLHAVLAALAKQGTEDPRTQKARRKLADEFMELKLSPRMFDALTAQLRTHIGEIRQIEKEIMIIAVRDAGMPRKDFIGTFPRNETSSRWIAKHVKAGKKYSAPLARLKDEIERRQKKLQALEVAYHLSIGGIKDINREVSIGEAKARRAKKEMVEANLRLVISIAK
ncbi:MAG: hypothetical protein KGJ52_11815, partial [Gammaproteobacteria bacterium]|nr:hypothetical protein [Gammaproteobacteria bacterium]